LWLLWGDALPDRDAARGPVERIFEVENLVSSFGVAVAVSVGAYVLGSIVLDIQTRVGRALRVDRGDTGVAFLFTRSGIDVMRAAVSPGRQGDLRYIDALHWVRQNREVLKTRLLDASSGLHSEIDRPDAEATFRLALWPPLVAVLVVVAEGVSSYWLIALVYQRYLQFNGLCGDVKRTMRWSWRS
jgi:hypothetical protein